MKQLTIIVPAGQTVLDSIAGSYMIFMRANQFRQQSGKKPLFEIKLAGISKDVKLYNGLFSVHPQSDIRDIKRTDLIIIPAFQPGDSFSEIIKRNETIVRWVTDQYKLGAEIISLCTGAFLLASTGLLDGKSCSTHWAAADAFRQMFPNVKLVPHKVIIGEHGIFTSAGAFSFLNFLLKIVDKFYGRETALFCSKIFEIDLDRESQAHFSIFIGRKNHKDEEIKKAQCYIEGNFAGRISIEDLASRQAIGRRNFDRRFKKATGITPIEYLQRVKVEAAKNSFETSRKSIKEIMYEVGYSDVKSFRTTFRKITGLSPLEYRKKFYRELVSASN